jgi:hypothetical protein
MATAAPVRPKFTGAEQGSELKIYSHSPILYWWPVWAVGFLMALATWAGNQYMIVVPADSVVTGSQVTAPQATVLGEPVIHMAQSRWPGIIFALTLLFAVFVTSATIRGPWALFSGAVVVTLILLFNWMQWWNPLYRWFGLLRVHLNLGAYLVISVPLFLMWILAIFFFDRRTYMVFSAGQVRIRDQLGKGEKVFDTGTVSFEKKQYDWLRPIVGLGAGDMVIRVGGPTPAVFELPNVVAVGHKMRTIELRLRTRHVV